MFKGLIYRVEGEGAVVLRYKPESLCFDSRRSHQKVHCSNPAGRSKSLVSTQPLTEKNNRGISWVQRLTADNLIIFMC